MSEKSNSKRKELDELLDRGEITRFTYYYERDFIDQQDAIDRHRKKKAERKSKLGKLGIRKSK